MLQDRVNDLLRQFDADYERCLRIWLDETGLPATAMVKDGVKVEGQIIYPRRESYRSFEFCGQEAFRVTIDQHFAVVVRWSPSHDSSKSRGEQPCE